MQERFTPPAPSDVSAYASSIGYSIDAERFCDYWSARGWEVRPRIRMKDWRAAVRNWRRQAAEWSAAKSSPQKPGLAEIDAHRSAEAMEAAKKSLPEMLYFVSLSRRKDAEGLERRQEAVERIAEISSWTRRQGGELAVKYLREMVRNQVKFANR